MKAELENLKHMDALVDALVASINKK